MTDVVLFDLFGVIARQQSTAAKERLVATAGVPAAEFWDAYWALRRPYDRGDMAGPDYWHAVAAALHRSFAPRRIAELVHADIASWSEVDEEMVDLVRGLSTAGQRIALLSNIPEELAAHYEKNHRWLRHFEMRAFSCRIGHAKPEPGAYRWCTRSLGLEPARVLFVDDREDNVLAAESTGLRAHHFTGAARLREALAEAGALPPGRR